MEVTNLDFKHISNCKLLPNRHNILHFIKKHGVGAEIGVLGGDWSRVLLEQLSPEKLVLVDTYYSDDYPHLKRFTKKGHEGYIRTKFELFENIIEVKKGLSWEVLAEYPENFFDWLYIDAAHDYVSVKKDLEQAKRTIKDDGIIIMNDYIMYDHIASENYGVIQATNEFMLENNYEMICFAFHPQMYCDVAIRKIVE